MRYGIRTRIVTLVARHPAANHYFACHFHAPLGMPMRLVAGAEAHGARSPICLLLAPRIRKAGNGVSALTPFYSVVFAAGVSRVNSARRRLGARGPWQHRSVPEACLRTLACR
jgi:hypothetical protein